MRKSDDAHHGRGSCIYGKGYSDVQQQITKFETHVMHVRLGLL